MCRCSPRWRSTIACERANTHEHQLDAVPKERVMREPPISADIFFIKSMSIDCRFDSSRRDPNSIALRDDAGLNDLGPHSSFSSMSSMQCLVDVHISL